MTVTTLDRLARSVRDLVQIVDRVERKGASLRILAMGLDTSTSAGRAFQCLFTRPWLAATRSPLMSRGPSEKER